MFTYRLKWLLCFIVLVAVVSIWLAETHQGISPLALLEARERCKEIPYGTPPAKVIELAGIKRFVAAETKTRVSTEYFIEADWHDSQVSVIAPNPTWSGGVNLKADWGNVRMQANDDSWRDYRRAVLTGGARSPARSQWPRGTDPSSI